MIFFFRWAYWPYITQSLFTPSLSFIVLEDVVNSNLYFSFGLANLKHALAARACFKLAKPNEKYRFEFTTSSKAIKDRLGVKSD